MPVPTAILEELPARLHEIPRRQLASRPEAPALIENGVVWSYAELVAAAAEARDWLRSVGVRGGDRVMLVGENCRALVAMIFALSELDAWAVIVNARLSPREIETIRSHCAARRVVYFSAASTEAALHAQHVGAEPLSVGRLGELALGELDLTCLPEPVQADSARQVAALIYTSGTTGSPKGVMLSHHNLLFIARSSSGLRRLSPDDQVFGVLPISHVYGLSSVCLGTLYAGACLQLHARFSATETLRALAEDGISVMQGVPAMYTRLLEVCGEAPRHTLRFIYAGGSPLDPALKQAVEARFGLPLHNGYGMTESSPTISQTRMDAPRTDVSVGPAIPGIEVAITDDEGRPLADGEVGELRVRGPNVMLGYYRNAELSAQTVDAAVWLRTGDLARREADGALFIVGRSKELIIRSGFNVYPVEVESVLNAHPAVVHSAVVGRAVAGNEEVVAFVELRDPTQASAEDLLAYLAERLSPYKRPSELVILPALPAAATGKILKSQLRQLAQEGAIAGQ